MKTEQSEGRAGFCHLEPRAEPDAKRLALGVVVAYKIWVTTISC